MGTVWVLLEVTINFPKQKSNKKTYKDKEKSEPFGSDFVVDDTRLELVTSRTSSGCSYQLS